MTNQKSCTSANRRGFIWSTLLAAGLAVTPRTSAQASGGALRSLIDRYFEAWHGSDPQKVLIFFSDDVVIDLLGDENLKGKQAVGEKWVIPSMKRYPGNVHRLQNYFEVDDRAVIEWIFSGVNATTHQEESFPGCSIYWVKDGLITRGHLYIVTS